MFGTYQALKLIGAGLVMIVIGIALWNMPAMRDDPNRMTFREMLTCSGPVLAGVVSIGLGVYFLVRKK